LRILISFDIDGTLEVGDPPGSITMAMVRRAQTLGYIVGSASDQTVSAQQSMWETHGIDVQFTVGKHRLGDVRSSFEADLYQHIGDSQVDEYYAVLNGFEFLHVAVIKDQPWMSEGPASGRPAD
jgi:hypothetical protein